MVGAKAAVIADGLRRSRRGWRRLRSRKRRDVRLGAVERLRLADASDLLLQLGGHVAGRLARGAEGAAAPAARRRGGQEASSGMTVKLTSASRHVQQQHRDDDADQAEQRRRAAASGPATGAGSACPRRSAARLMRSPSGRRSKSASGRRWRRSNSRPRSLASTRCPTAPTWQIWAREASGADHVHQQQQQPCCRPGRRRRGRGCRGRSPARSARAPAACAAAPTTTSARTPSNRRW